MMLYSGSGVGLVVGVTSSLLNYNRSASYKESSGRAGIFTGIGIGLVVSLTVWVVERCLPTSFRPITFPCLLLVHSTYVYLLVTQVPRIQTVVDGITAEGSSKLRA